MAVKEIYGDGLRVKVGKRPLLRQFGREIGYMYGAGTVGAAAGALGGAALGGIAGRGSRDAMEIGGKIGGGIGATVGGLKGSFLATRKSEVLRKHLGIGGKPITPLRTFGLQVLGSAAQVATGVPFIGALANPSVRLAMRRHRGLKAKKSK